MIIVVLTVLGLCLGSFVNALVWRVHEQETEKGKKKPNAKRLKDLSIMKGRSMCPHCKHELGVKDLLPVISYLSVGGKCRHCRKPISQQYPLVEIATAGLFILTYLYWPLPLHGWQSVVFGLWLLIETGLMALAVYDLKWYLLPNRMLYPLSVIAGLVAVINIGTASHVGKALLDTVLAVAVGGGIFYVLFQISSGRWIGGGDVKLGWMLGLLVSTPARSMLLIFAAALLGSFISLPLLAAKKLKPNSTIPFGPFLILAAVVVQLFGHSVLFWYQKTFLDFTL